MNQNLGLSINDKVDLVYQSIDDTLQIKTFKIVDVIKESTTKNNIYYNLDLLTDTFDEVLQLDDDYVLTYDKYIAKTSMLAQMDIDYNDIEAIYQENPMATDYSFYQPTYDERVELKNNTMLFKIMSYSFQLIYFVAILLFIGLYNYRSNQKIMKYYALLLEFGESRKNISKYHFLNKLLATLPDFVILTLACLIITKLFHIYLVNVDYAVLIAISLIIIISYLLTANLKMNQLHQSKLNEIRRIED